MLLGLAGEEPVRHVGLGMRSMDDVSLLAFMGGLEQVVSRFVGEEGVMKQLGPILGRLEGDRRWEDMLDSGCRTGVELVQLWVTLQLQAREMCLSMLCHHSR